MSGGWINYLLFIPEMGANSVKLDTAAPDVEPTNPIPSTGHVTIENSYNSSWYTDVIQSLDDCTSRDSSICSFSMDEIQQAISDLDKTIEKPLANQNPHKARNSPTTSPIPHLSLEEQMEAEESIINEFSPREVSREQDISAKLGTVSGCGNSSNQDSVNSVHSKLKQVRS